MDEPKKISIYGDADLGDKFLQLWAPEDNITPPAYEEDDSFRHRGEADWKLREATEYEYKLPSGCAFKEHPAISPSRIHSNCGRIRTGNYVGTLRLELENGSGYVEMEVVSRKIGYRDDYQKMLADIAETSAELLMSQSEYVFQNFDIDLDVDADSLYQRFTFARSLIESDSFAMALSRIFAAPLRTMSEIQCEIGISEARRLGRNALRQIASATDRIGFDGKDGAGWDGVPSALTSIPRRIASTRREETADVPENRFVKFVLESFADFIRDISSAEKASGRLKQEAERLLERLDLWLSEPIFRRIGRLDRIPLSSPALQRREGYREILRAWLMFDSAAKLAWSGGEDVYRAGKKNIAALYEYWAFFKMLEVFEKTFSIHPHEKDRLISADGDGLELHLRQGNQLPVFRGDYLKKINAEFSYNKTFGKDSPDESWTVAMRPDYSLTLWPNGMEKSEAACLGMEIHLHFDAKYKIENLKDVFSDDANEDGAGVEKYRRGDLLKMHAYNDAIRRTYGSYILYPGNDAEEFSRFPLPDFLPGIGAFVLRPNAEGGDTSSLEDFIRRVANHLVDCMEPADGTLGEREAPYEERSVQRLFSERLTSRNSDANVSSRHTSRA